MPVTNIQGEEAIHNIPSLALKKWNATRWLGRHKCLATLCGALQHVLDHFQAIQQDRSYDKSARETAQKLYDQLTNYDVFLFLFYYEQVTEIMATTSKQLQRRQLEISDVGRDIVTLVNKLNAFFPRGSIEPEELMGNGTAYEIMKELFQNDIHRIPSILPKVVNC